MASNAASSVQFRVNGTEMARGRTRKTERSQSMDPRAKPRAAGASKVNVETTVTNGSLSSIPKTQATSVLPVAREESQRLSAGDFPEADFWPIQLRKFRFLSFECRPPHQALCPQRKRSIGSSGG